MAIKFICSYCGAKLTVPDNLAGKRGPCPKCNVINIVPMESTRGDEEAQQVQEHFSSPQSAAPGSKSDYLEFQQAKSDKVSYQCDCGKLLKVSAKFSGRPATCPSCGKKFVVPEPSTAASVAQAAPQTAQQPPSAGARNLYATSSSGITFNQINLSGNNYGQSAKFPSWAKADAAKLTRIQTHGLGGGGSFRRGWSFFKESFRMLKDNKGMLTPLLITMGVSLVLLGIMGGAIYLIVNEVGMNEFQTFMDENPWLNAVIFVVLSIPLLFVMYFGMAMTVSVIFSYFSGVPITLKQAFKMATKRTGGIFFLAVIGSLMNLLASLVRGNRGGIFRRLAAAAIERFWTVASALVLPAMMIQDLSFGASFKKAKDVGVSNLLTIGIGEVGIFIINRILVFALVLVLVPVVWLLLPLGMFGIIVSIVIALAAIVVLNALLSFVRVAYYTSLYVWVMAVEESKVKREAFVPIPLARALQVA